MNGGSPECRQAPKAVATITENLLGLVDNQTSFCENVTGSTHPIHRPYANLKPMNHPSDDLFDLKRFLDAQSMGVYESALAEIKNGAKLTHWMWFVFPQFKNLGTSATSIKYAIKSLAEAKAYLEHPILGARLRECGEAMLGVQGKTAHEILSSPDDHKLQSCCTLFAHISEQGSVFEKVLDRYYAGERDGKTIQMIFAGER